MPTKYFCDLCDHEIEDDVFDTRYKETGKKKRGSRIVVGMFAKWVVGDNPNHLTGTPALVCNDCIKRILLDL